MSGRVVVAITYTSDNLMSRQLYGIKFIYIKGSHCTGRFD